MKKVIFLLVIVLLFVVACGSQKVSDEQHDIDLLEEILPKLQQNPDSILSKCETFLTDNGKEICYTTYLVTKSQRDEWVASSVCEHISEDKANSFCVEYTS